MHLLNIIRADSTSLWANWINTTVLKGRNLWNYLAPSDCSWIWKQVLKLRPIAKNHVSYLVGNGSHTSLWFDPWINGNLINPSQTLLANSGLSSKAKVVDIIFDSSWSLPPSFHHEMIELRSLIEAQSIHSLSNDRSEWNGLSLSNLKARHVWDCIRTKKSIPIWHKLHVPRFSFILWSGFLRKLPTNDITRHYSSGSTSSSPLCLWHDESFDHLFFECLYSYSILQETLELGDWSNVPMDWTGVSSFIFSFRDRKISKLILYLTFAATFYNIWECENSKDTFEQAYPPSIIAKDTINIIKSRLSSSSLFIKASHSSPYYCNWLLWFIFGVGSHCHEIGAFSGRFSMHMQYTAYAGSLSRWLLWVSLGYRAALQVSFVCSLLCLLLMPLVMLGHGLVWLLAGSSCCSLRSLVYVLLTWEFVLMRDAMLGEILSFIRHGLALNLGWSGFLMGLICTLWDWYCSLVLLHFCYCWWTDLYVMCYCFVRAAMLGEGLYKKGMVLVCAML